MSPYTLSKPIEFNGKTYSVLNFREPTIGDMMVTDAVKGELSKTVALLAAVADTPLQVFKLIPLSELKNMEAIVENPWKSRGIPWTRPAPDCLRDRGDPPLAAARHQDLAS